MSSIHIRVFHFQVLTASASEGLERLATGAMFSLHLAIDTCVCREKYDGGHTKVTDPGVFLLIIATLLCRR